MKEKEIDEWVDMLSVIAKAEVEELTKEDIEVMIIQGRRGWVDEPIEAVRERYQAIQEATNADDKQKADDECDEFEDLEA